MSIHRLPRVVFVVLLGSLTALAAIAAEGEPDLPVASDLPAASDLHAARAEVQAASEAWIKAFNRGDYQACAAGYSEDASMQGRPLADIQGRAAIAEFWQGVLAQNPGELVYDDPQIHVLSERTAVLSARWSMSRLGRGIITLERWEKQADGRWRLTEDIFEILEQFSAAE